MAESPQEGRTWTGFIESRIRGLALLIEETSLATAAVFPLTVCSPPPAEAMAKVRAVP